LRTAATDRGNIRANCIYFYRVTDSPRAADSPTHAIAHAGIGGTTFDLMCRTRVAHSGDD